MCELQLTCAACQTGSAADSKVGASSALFNMSEVAIAQQPTLIVYHVAQGMPKGERERG